MDALTNVLEFVEELNTSSKINEGQYLDIVNKLKVIHQSLPVPRVAEQPATRASGSEPAIVRTTDNWVIPYRATFYSYTQGFRNYEDLRGRLFCLGTMRYAFETAFFDCYLNPSSESIEAFKVQFEARNEPDDVYVIGDEFIHRLSSMTSVKFKDANYREAFLTIPFIRKSVVHANVYRKKLMWDNIKGFAPNRPSIEQQQIDLAKLLNNCSVPLYNQFRCVREGIVQRDIKKLHSIKLTVCNTPVELMLYTEKVQLGRTCLSVKVFTLAMSIYLMNYGSTRFEACPIERFLIGMNVMNNDYDAPKLKTSGITSSTRDKHRTYVYERNNTNEIVFSYECKFNKK